MCKSVAARNDDNAAARQAAAVEWGELENLPAKTWNCVAVGVFVSAKAGVSTDMVAAPKAESSGRIKALGRATVALRQCAQSSRCTQQDSSGRDIGGTSHLLPKLGHESIAGGEAPSRSLNGGESSCSGGGGRTVLCRIRSNSGLRVGAASVWW